MRIALISDIHGNAIALDAVLRDVEKRGEVDAYWVLGDLVAIGPDPIGVMARLMSLPNAVFIRGNTDRYIVTGDRPEPSEAEVASDPSLLSRYREVNECFAWAQGAITGAGYFEWFSGLSLEHRYTLADGTRCLGVHASPGKDDGPGVNPLSTDADLRKLFKDCAADIVFVGHTHAPCDRMVDDIRLVNLGSVSNPHPPDLRASYVLLEASMNSYELAHHRVEYDHATVISECERLKHPATRFITRLMLGQNKPPWEAA